MRRMETVRSFPQDNLFWRSRGFWLLLSGVVTCGVVGYLFVAGQRATQAAELEANAIHQALVGGRYDLAYDAADGSFRSRISRADFVRYALAARGVAVSCTSATVPRLAASRSGLLAATVRLEYRSPCDRGTLHESFTFVVGRGVARLMQYEVRGP